jgi:hypothetical protein
MHHTPVTRCCHRPHSAVTRWVVVAQCKISRSRQIHRIFVAESHEEKADVPLRFRYYHQHRQVVIVMRVVRISY